MPKFQHVGVSSLRVFTGKRLATLTAAVVICDHAEPIAAMVPYSLYLAWQELLLPPKARPAVDGGRVSPSEAAVPSKPETTSKEPA